MHKAQHALTLLAQEIPFCGVPTFVYPKCSTQMLHQLSSFTNFLKYYPQKKKKNKCPLKHVTILREKFVESIIFHGKKPGKTSPWVGFFEPGNSWSTENEGIRPPKKQGTYFTIGN